MVYEAIREAQRWDIELPADYVAGKVVYCTVSNPYHHRSHIP